MSSVPLPVLFGLCGLLLVGAIYFVWARKVKK
jgi:LPXTG-motif cell wall-anchored protein